MGFLKSVGNFLDPNAPAREANKQEAKTLKELLALFDAQGTQNNLAFGKAESNVRAQLPLVRKAFGDANANLALTADRQRRTVLAREAPAMAGANAQVFRAGGGASNLGSLVSRGVRGDTTRAMQSLDDLFQQHFSQNAIGQAQGLGSVYDQLGNLQVGKAQAGMGITQGKAAAISGKQHFQSGGFGAWLELIGKAGKAYSSFGSGGAPGAGPGAGAGGTGAPGVG